MSVVDPTILPRRVRAITSNASELPVLLSYRDSWSGRSRRLLASLDELEREIRDCSSSFGYASLRSESGGSPRDEVWNESQMQDSLQRARQATVRENNKTREFLRARGERKGDECDDLWRWMWYKKTRRLRRTWGELLRSNMDWDWDTASSLKRLFRTEDEGKARLGVRQCTSNYEAFNSHLLEVSIEEPPLIVPEVIRLRYKTKTGEVAFKTFYAGSSVENSLI